jgi:hypothetical protein
MMDDKDPRRTITFMAYGGVNAPGVHVSLKEESMEELVEAFRSFALAMGFHPETVKSWLDSE